MKKILSCILSIALCVTLLAACAAQNEKTAETTTGITAATVNQTDTSPVVNNDEIFDSEDLNTSAGTAASLIALNSTSIDFDGSGATVKGSNITITAAGTYSISGTLNDGQIIVDAGDSDVVRIILNGADITCATSAPIYIKSAQKTVITLAAGMQNHLTDAASYILDDTAENEPNATVFSKSDLTFNGSGSLLVDAYYNNAINCKDELKITGGSITVNSVDDGIIGKDCVAVQNADITVNAQGDGVKSTNAEDAARGYVYIAGNTVKITSGTDAIQAETVVQIISGSITLKAGGGSGNSINQSQNQFGMGYSSNTDTATVSTKGIKAVKNIIIDGGTYNIDSADDAVHSNGSITINGGTFTITSGDDGVHADAALTINDGTINISKSYEGLESMAMIINGGDIRVVAGDDGINCAGGNDGSSVNGRPGQNGFSSSGDISLIINGGYIVADGSGDGIDINGSITMTGGTIIVNGPTDDGNAAWDYDSTCKVTGGTIIAAGSAGMATAPDSTSTLCSVKMNFDSVLPAGTMVHIQTQAGEDVLTFVPLRKYQSIVLCTSALKKGENYTVYTGGNSTGTIKDGLYTGGSYSGGTEYTSFSVSSVVTNIGSSSNMGGPRRP